MEVIPAIDLRGGQVVRLEQGDFARETVHGDDPAAAAVAFARLGASRLHVVDLDGSRSGTRVNRASLEAIVAACPGLRVQTGGGIRALEDVGALLALGVERVVLGTAALEDPDLVRTAAVRSPGRVIVGVDARNGIVATRGWTASGSTRVEEVVARFQDLPLAAFLYTDIQRDGLLTGPDVEGTARLARSTSIPVIASGGVGTLEHLRALARARVIAAVVVGKALYTGAVRLDQALREVAAC
jgi:phosphoribosylformimino-5-aminoimidazole carboxamide ribotide isomerase